MKNKIINLVLAVCLMLSSITLLSACGKKDQINTLNFTGVFQSAEGHVYVQIDNVADYDENVEFEYTVDGGTNWENFGHYKHTFTQTDKSLYLTQILSYTPDLANKTLNVAVRLKETNKLNASEASNFISYKVKPRSLVVETFDKYGDASTGNYEWGQGWGIQAFKICEKQNKTFKVEKYDYVEDNTNGNMYKYTFVENNWDTNAIKFEYKFVSHFDAFYSQESYNLTGLNEYENIAKTSGWVNYNPTVGITKSMYESHIENNGVGCIGCYNKTFTILIRVKETETNLASVCSPVTVKVEEIMGEIPA